MGLKAYDLVWLEGKSAAWRYPCEVEELKEFAPPVEEQPFDRFYRRPSAASAVAATTAAASTLVAKTVETSVPLTVESAKTSGKRIIYVTMPAGKSPAGPASAPLRDREPVRVAAPPAREPNLPAREPVREPVHEPVRESLYQPVQPAPLAEHSTETAVTNPAMDLLPRRRPRHTARVIRFLAIGFCILALLLAGIFIGLSLNKDTLPFGSRVVAKLPPTTDQSIVHPTTQKLPPSASVSPAVTDNRTKAADSAAAVVSRPAVPAPEITKPAITPITPRAASKSGKGTRVKQPRSLSQANVALKKDSAAGGLVREAVHRADVAPDHHDDVPLPDKEAVKMAVASQVSVGANGYSVGTFGGISGLQLTVTNRSVYPLDLVVVEVQYIQANKKIYKTENLFFRGIGAGSALMQEAPRSSRGVKVQCRITNISSKELGLSYSVI